MKRYEIDYSPEAEAGIIKLKKAGDKQALKKLKSLIEELKIHPRKGTGKPEPLKGFNEIRWSRRITDKHRLVYDIFDQILIVEVTQTYGHYDDK